MPSAISGRPDCGVHPIALKRTAWHARYVTSRILIVDDSESFRAAAAGLLVERGFEVLVTAGDGEQALVAAADGCPDGILVDINLPDADGFAVAASLAAACPRARIVLTSAAVDRVPAEVLSACAAVAFVPKQELAVTDLGALLAD
jgi:DNA-binding NarL/FixJ family response regulator